jgi:perosamine synthetase
MTSYGRHSIDDDDIEAVAQVLRGDWLTQGPHLEEFESALATRVGAKFAVAFTSGTAALHAACAAAELRPGDQVAVPALTFSASAACARYVGADPVLMDIDPDSLNFDPATVPATADALVAVHYGGLPVDLSRLGHRPRIVIEDACHALGAMTPDGPVGGCSHSDMSCFSFHPVKPITTAEGGAVTTNDPSLAERLRRFRNHGIVPRPDVDGPWYYEVVELGFNYRLSDLHAALGSSQLRKLDRFLDIRDDLAARYDRDLPASVRRPPAAPDGFRHGRHLYAVRVPRRAEALALLRERGLGVQVHYVPLYRHPVYRQPADRFPGTEAAYAGLLSLPMHPEVTLEHQLATIATLTEICG